MQKEKLKGKKGITLIALIITIIVMLILVGVSIEIVVNSNLLNTAKSAGEQTEAKYEEDKTFGDSITIDGKDYYIQSDGQIVEQGIKTLKIYRNSVQDGRPLYNSPVAIQSVGDYDETTGKYKIPVKVTNGAGESTTTNIYLDEPLRKVGEYADYIDYENSKVIRYIYNEYITSVYNKSSVAGTYSMFLSEISKTPLLTGASSSPTGYAISNKFSRFEGRYHGLINNANSIQSYITSGGLNRVAYTFDDSAINTVEQAQEKIGNGFEVCYVLAEPIEQLLELPKIPTHKGTNIIEIGTEIQPSEVIVEF